jgi:4-amino-4-deoxy-L-arabinose transferase-like glycosyltransferase
MTNDPPKMDPEPTTPAAADPQPALEAAPTEPAERGVVDAAPVDVSPVDVLAPSVVADVVVAPDASPAAEPGARTVSAPVTEPAVEEIVAVVPGAGLAASEALAGDETALTPAPIIAETPGRWPLLLAVLVPILFFFILPPLTKSGLWDPFELNVADLSRRLALHLFGADSLALAATDNSLPHLNDLGRPQLAFTSIALGFKLFGLHVWAGRAPLALWGVAGVVATYGFVSRLVDKRAGLYAAVILSAMPLYFVQARTMLGDIVTMSALAMAFGGLTVAVFDQDEHGPTAAGPRIPWLIMGIVGLAAGFGSRGGVLGLAVPLLSVGIAWALSHAAGRGVKSSLASALGALSLALGVLFFGMGWFALLPDVQNSGHLYPLISLGQVRGTDMNMWIGAAVKTPAKYPTFDYYIGHLGPALAPWSALAPFAVGRLLAPPAGRAGQPRLFERESFARMALLVGTSVALVAHAFLAQRTELIAFCAPALIAAICAIALRDYERGAHPSVALAVGAGVILGVFHHDFHELPEKAYQAFAVTGATFPESFKEHALLIWTVVLISFAGISFLTWVERDAARRPFEPRGYLNVLISLREAWDGFLALFYLAAVAGTSIAGIAIAIGTRLHAHWLATVSMQIRGVAVNLWWAVAFGPLAAILAVYFACDVWLWAFGRARPFSKASFLRGFEPFETLYAEVMGDTLPRPEKLTAALVLGPLMTLALPAVALAVLVTKVGVSPWVSVVVAVSSELALFLILGALGDFLRGSRVAFLILWGSFVGFILCFSYYPALANQLSPKEIFESYERLHKSGEPLALLGVGGKTSAYYAGGQPATFTDTTAGFNWLVAGGVGGSGPRRFLATKAEDLAKMNQLYRERSQPRVNVPVVDGRSSQILLLASSLGDDTDQNSLDKIALAAPPSPQHRLDVNMEDKLQVLGYDITDQAGHLIDYIAPGGKYRMRTYYKVLAPITTEWEAFIHIDGFHRRHNGDHKPMEGKYPLSLWLKDDLLVDDYEIGLEPNFTPGDYELFFGLFSGETRLKVKSGPNDGENRIDGGTIRVQ